ncbi:hypothetical protein HDU67_000158 [Dinochytrium kinnereticum]|nr:hypothetical protein HDU67_000158 [Dinochytrium kinnereticum]
MSSNKLNITTLTPETPFFSWVSQITGLAPGVHLLNILPGQAQHVYAPDGKYYCYAPNPANTNSARPFPGTRSDNIAAIAYMRDNVGDDFKFYLDDSNDFAIQALAVLRAGVGIEHAHEVANIIVKFQTFKMLPNETPQAYIGRFAQLHYQVKELDTVARTTGIGQRTNNHLSYEFASTYFLNGLDDRFNTIKVILRSQTFDNIIQLYTSFRKVLRDVPLSLLSPTAPSTPLDDLPTALYTSSSSRGRGRSHSNGPPHPSRPYDRPAPPPRLPSRPQSLPPSTRGRGRGLPRPVTLRPPNATAVKVGVTHDYRCADDPNEHFADDGTHNDQPDDWIDDDQTGDF